MSYFLLKYMHVIGACVLFGTGMGIAFFMFFAVNGGEYKRLKTNHKTHEIALIAGVSRIVVVADYIFTLVAALIQPVTGLALVWMMGYSLSTFWVWGSLLLYLFIGVLWVPVVFMQIEMKVLAEKAVFADTPLGDRFYLLFRRWVLFGIPAFGAIMIIFWLMITKPDALF